MSHEPPLSLLFSLHHFRVKCNVTDSVWYIPDLICVTGTDEFASSVMSIYPVLGQWSVISDSVHKHIFNRTCRYRKHSDRCLQFILYLRYRSFRSLPTFDVGRSRIYDICSLLLLFVTYMLILKMFV